jgi:DNA-binding NarL/FixJ family response regulator
MTNITVLLADDHQLFRAGICALLKPETDIQVVGEAENGRQAVELFQKLAPAVVLMDIAMPLLNGLQAGWQIRKTSASAKLIMLTGHGDDTYLDQVSDLGVSGYLLKQSSSAQLVNAIRQVAGGKRVFSPEISRRVVERSREKTERQNRGSPTLTAREKEVLQLIAEGKANKQVAAELGVTFKTVDKHRQHLMSKLHIHDVAGLTRYAIAEGIIENSVRENVKEAADRELSPARSKLNSTGGVG